MKISINRLHITLPSIYQKQTSMRLFVNIIARSNQSPCVEQHDLCGNLAEVNLKRV